MTKIKPFKIISEKYLFEDGDRFKVVQTQLQNHENKIFNWTYIHMRDGAIVFPLDKDNNVYIKKEWRLGRKDFVWEFPSGWVEKDDPSEADILETANKELQEEAGFKANKLTLLSSFYLSNHADNKLHIILAQDFVSSKLEGDEHEYVEIEKLEFEEAKDRLLSKQIPTVQLTLAFNLVEKFLRINN